MRAARLLTAKVPKPGMLKRSPLRNSPAMVSVTGSVRAGMEVAASAAAGVKRVHLELGGKAPVVVFDDADVEAAAEGIAFGGFFNAGQDCTAATRVLAGPRIHDQFVAALVERARSGRGQVLESWLGSPNVPRSGAGRVDGIEVVGWTG